MMPRAMLVALLMAVFGACRGSHGDGLTLPYYDSSEFTARWSPPAAHQMEPFEFRTQTGARLTPSDLSGRIHVASFIFTTCPTICPAMVTQLKRVQQAGTAWPDVRLVSYSVTPVDDTPEVLAAFGRDRGINPARWLLVTGDAKRIYRLARAFYYADDRRLTGSETEAEQFLHTEKVLLVDRDGQIRGVYNGTVPFDMDRLIQDVDRLRISGH